MKYFKMSLGVVLLMWLQVAAFAQTFEPYIPEDQMPDPARLEMAIRDAVWSLDTTLVILGEPSGHTIRAWACALLMSQINPASAEAVFARAWLSGESRVISGCHWQSDVDASRPVAGIGYARLQTSADFQRDMARAQAEFRKLSAKSR